MHQGLHMPCVNAPWKSKNGSVNGKGDSPKLPSQNRDAGRSCSRVVASSGALTAHAVCARVCHPRASTETHAHRHLRHVGTLCTGGGEVNVSRLWWRRPSPVSRRHLAGTRSRPQGTGSANQALELGHSQRQVDVLHGLDGRPLEQVVLCCDDHGISAVGAHLEATDDHT